MSGSLVLETLGAARDLGRLHDIASVFVRHGLGDAVRRSGLLGALKRAGQFLHLDSAKTVAAKPTEQRVREALEELGPTFVKAGQILAGRSDLLPEEWTRELAKLHEGAAPVPIEAIRAQLTEDLGAPPEEVFDGFDPEPLAAASIAQVHRARLRDGTEVVLKVRRPGIRRVVEADLRLLARLAELAENELHELRRFRPRSLVRQITRSLRRELDLRNEARNARRLRELLGEETGILIPEVHDEWSHERLCVCDYLEGPSLAEWIEAGEFRELTPAKAARVGADAVLEMVFVHGFFHADPHPGNVVVLEDGRLGLLDFGMVGFLSDWRRIEFLELLAAVATDDEEEVVEILLTWSEDGFAGTSHLRSDVAEFLAQYRNIPLRELDAGTLLGDITRLLRENDLFLPDELALLLKVFVTLESLGRRLDPDFVMSKHVEPFVRRALTEHHAPKAVLKRGTSELAHVLATLPKNVRRILSRAGAGRLGVDIGVPQLERFSDRMTRSANRVTVGLVTSALIIGTAISTTVARGPHAFGMPLLGLIGFVSSVAVGAWLVFSIMRSRH